MTYGDFGFHVLETRGYESLFVVPVYFYWPTKLVLSAISK